MSQYFTDCLRFRFWRWGTSSLITTATICIITMSRTARASELTGNLTAGDRYHAQIDNPPRLQWNANYGYCGEVSMISAGLRYGQYVSQYEARAIASNNTPQYKDGSQLLLGVNDVWAASQMHLKSEPYDNSGGPNAPAFLNWIKDGVLASSSVIMAVYTNEHLFYGDTNPKAGDSTYDHIVPVIGVSSDYPLQTSSSYHANDTITFSDNGLWAPGGKPSYIWQYDDDSFQANRGQANQKSAAVYSLPSTIKNYGLIISGIIDNDGQTLPVHLTTNINYEKPSIKKHSNTRPKAENLVLTITVDALEAGKDYNLYRYSNFSSVPNASFNAHSSQAMKSWQIKATGTTYTLNETIMSDQIAVYRAVPVIAP